MSTDLLVTLNTAGAAPPIFLVPSAGKTPYSMLQLGRALKGRRPVFAFSFQGMDDERTPHESIEDMAGAFVKEIEITHPSGPLVLGGHCFGGIVAFEMVAQLERAGREVAALLLLEAVPPGAAKGDPKGNVDPQIITAVNTALSQTIDRLGQLRNERAQRYGAITGQQLGLALHYDPQKPIQAPITLFCSSAQPENVYNRWPELTNGNWHVYRVGGDTFSMLNKPHVAGLGEKIQRSL